MNRQSLLFQSMCVFLIASSVYGGQLPASITSQYDYCYELAGFAATSRTGTESSPLPNSDLIDNVCMNLQRSSFHFLSSAQGGTISYITASKVGMIVTFLVSVKIGIKADCLPVVSLLCQFQEPSHALHIYNDIYEDVDLTRHDFTIGRIQKLMLDEQTGSQIVTRSELAQLAALYTEFDRDMRLIFTFKQESANGDVGNAVLVYFAHQIKISDVLANNNIVFRFYGYSLLAVVMTFRNRSEAISFRDALRRHVNPVRTMPIPPSVEEVLRTTRM